MLTLAAHLSDPDQHLHPVLVHTHGDHDTPIGMILQHPRARHQVSIVTLDGMLTYPVSAIVGVDPAEDLITGADRAELTDFALWALAADVV